MQEKIELTYKVKQLFPVRKHMKPIKEPLVLQKSNKRNRKRKLFILKMSTIQKEKKSRGYIYIEYCTDRY